MPTDQQIAETVSRLAGGQFEEALWPVCYKLVRREITRRNLPARDYAPVGSSNWTVDDFTALADEWLVQISGDRARKLLGTDRTNAHVANAARRSIYHLVLEHAKTTPRRDLWAALQEALPDFISMTTGDPRPDWTEPNKPFPWQQREQRSARRRAVTKNEVYAALTILQSQQPSGWTSENLFTCLESWTEIAGTIEQSLDGLSGREPSTSDYQIGAPDSDSIGRDVAQSLLRKLDKNERAVLRGFLVPNGLGDITLEQAAKDLGIAKSTLHDRAERLKTKLASMEHADAIAMDAASRQAFFDEILGQESGNPTAEPSTE